MLLPWLMPSVVPAIGEGEPESTWKAVYVDYSDKLQRAQIDNAE
jgi:hypothetical protein